MKHETRWKSRSKFQKNSVIVNRKIPESDPRAGIWILKLLEVSGARWNLDPETSGSFQKQTPRWNLDPETSGSFQNVVSGNLNSKLWTKLTNGGSGCRRVCAAARLPNAMTPTPYTFPPLQSFR